MRTNNSMQGCATAALCLLSHVPDAARWASEQSAYTIYNLRG